MRATLIIGTRRERGVAWERTEEGSQERGGSARWIAGKRTKTLQ
jgi:hypothetical protein